MSGSPLDERLAPAVEVADAVLHRSTGARPPGAEPLAGPGVLVPSGGVRTTEPSARSWQRTQVVLEHRPGTTVDVRVRYRTLSLRPTAGPGPGAGWDEVERTVDVTAVAASGQERVVAVEHGAPEGAPDGRPLVVAVTVRTEPVPGPYPLATVTVLVENRTQWSEPGASPGVLAGPALVGVHSILAVDRGRFLSTVEPPEFASWLVAACLNEGTWPVLVDGPSVLPPATLVLSSPVVVGDRPAGPGHPTGPAGSDRAVEGSTEPVWIAGVAVGPGSKVRLRPARRADVHDLFLAGKVATVHAVREDYDDEVHLAVTLDDDPAAELHDWYGRYHYFRPEEIEPLEGAVSDR